MNAFKVVAIPESDYPWPEPFRPYCDLETKFFCGRDSERATILANLLTTGITVLHGPSGVGKSSVLWAGVVPDLRAYAEETGLSKAPETVAVYIRDWGKDPVQTVRHAVRDACRQVPDLDVNRLEGESASLVDFLHGCTRDERVRLFVILDQLEDIFSDPSAAEGLGHFRDQFARSAQRKDIGVNFLLGIRQDWLGALEYFKASIPWILDNRLQLDDLGREGAQNVIEKPPAVYAELVKQGQRVTVDSGLTEAILRQVDETRRRSPISPASTLLRPSAESSYPAVYLTLIMRRLWERNRGASQLGREALKPGEVDSIIQSHVDDVLNDPYPIDDRNVAALALEKLVTAAGSTIEYPLRELDLSDPAFDRTRLDTVVDYLEDKRLIHTVGDRRHRLFHDLLVDPIRAWLHGFRSMESFSGFARVFHQALHILKGANRELWWINFVLRFGEPHLTDARTAKAYRQYTGRDFKDDVDGFFGLLLQKATRLELVRILTLSEAGTRQFLRGLRNLQEGEQSAAADSARHSGALKVQDQVNKCRDANRQLLRGLASVDSKGSVLRQVFETNSLPIQLIIADKAGSQKSRCLAFMVGSEAYRVGERREGLVAAHYTEDDALVSMYRNLAVVLMEQPGVTLVWPEGLNDQTALDISGESVRKDWRTAPQGQTGDVRAAHNALPLTEH